MPRRASVQTRPITLRQRFDANLKYITIAVAIVAIVPSFVYPLLPLPQMTQGFWDHLQPQHPSSVANVTAPATAVAWRQTRDRRTLLAEVCDLIENGQSRQAELKAQQIVNQHPDDGAALYLVGLAIWDQGGQERAARDRWEKIQLRPSGALEYTAYGWVLCRLDKLQLGLEALRKATALEPDASAFRRLGNALLGASSYQVPRTRVAAAAAAFRSALTYDPLDAEAHRGLARSLLRQGATRAAWAEWERVLELAPDSATYHDQFAYLLWNDQRFDDALAHSKAAIRLGPNDVYYYTRLAWRLEELGQHDQAISQWRHALRLAPNNPYYSTRLADELWQTDHWDEAMQFYEIAAENNPQKRSALLSISDKYATLKRFDDSERVLRQAQKARDDVTEPNGYVIPRGPNLNL